MKKNISRAEQGYAATMLLVFMVVGVIVATTAVSMTIANSQAVTKFSISQEVYAAAEGGYENALLQLIRNPSYTGETFTVGNVSVSSTVTGTGPYTIRSSAQMSNMKRSIQAQANWINGIFTVTSWSEVYD